MSRRRMGLFFLACAWLASLTAPVSAAPVALPTPPVEGIQVERPPELTAQSWILYDETYDLVLASSDASIPRAMASTTKIMTALVALDSGDPERMITVSERADAVGESEVGLAAGQQVELGALITAMMVQSGNDAAVAIAEGVAGTEEAFVRLMNERARQLGLTNTSFANSHGLDAPGHYSSAEDLLALGREAMANPAFARAAAARLYRFPGTVGSEPKMAVATNVLLWDYEGAIGVKTGFTNDAGMVLVSAAERSGRRLYAVVMGSEQPTGHFADSRALLDYGFEAFGVVPLIVSGETYGVRLAGTSSEPLTAAASAEAFVHLAAAGLFAPRLDLVDGEPTLVAETNLLEVPVESGVAEPLPGPGDAMTWLWSSGS